MGQQNSALPPLEENQKDITHQNEDLQSLPFFIPENHQLESATLAGNKISVFPLKLDKLRYLDMSKNFLCQINLESYDFQYDNLQILNLSGNGLKTLPSGIINCPNLIDLTLSHNELSETSFDFTKLSKLQNLDLLLNHFKSMPNVPDSLTSLNIGFNIIKTLSFSSPNIRRLNLSGNEITEFTDNISLPCVNFLDLSMNHLIEFPPIAKFAPALEILLAQHNFISNSPTEFPTTITKIDLSHNCIKSICNIRNLVNLREFNISFNRLKSIPSLPQSLQIFNAESNEIEESPPITLKSLTTLQLSGNSFTNIPDIRDSYISSLSMKNNKIQTFNTSNISGVTKKIDLTNNFIEEIPEDLYQMNKIQVISFDNNRLFSISPDISLMNLTSLVISESSISDLPELPKFLITLVACHCEFKTIPKSVYDAQRLSMIDFSINHIKNIEKFPNVITIKLSMNQITSIPPLSDKMKYLDVSHNKIKSVELYGDFILIQDLDFSHNHLTVFNTSKLPLLQTLKISHNKNLQFHIVFPKFPALKAIDITRTLITASLPLPKTIRDFSTSDAHFFKEADSPFVRLFLCDSIGYSEMIGNRPTMEDSLILRQDFFPKTHLLAVIDGHGGSDTATLSAYFIPEILSKNKEISLSLMAKTFRLVNEELRKRSVKDGAAVVVAIVSPKEIGIAHLGDSRALIVRKDKKVITLTRDHKPTERSEINLLKENRSFIEENRTAGILAMSRSLGDFRIPGVSHLPDVTNYKRDINDYRLVLACDGVFDVIDNNEIGEIVCSTQSVTKAACVLRNVAFSRGSLDNISTIVANIEFST